ncbi:hypothetical protein [Saccharopolyspora tripterygii]
MVAQVWQWTGGRVAACVVPLLLLVGGCALMYAHREGEALGWLGVAVTVVTIVFVFGHWGRYSDYDGRRTVKLPALVWLFRIVQYVLGVLAALFVLSWVLSTVFAS